MSDGPRGPTRASSSSVTDDDEDDAPWSQETAVAPEPHESTAATVAGSFASLYTAEERAARAAAIANIVNSLPRRTNDCKRCGQEKPLEDPAWCRCSVLYICGDCKAKVEETSVLLPAEDRAEYFSTKAAALCPSCGRGGQWKSVRAMAR